jgi:hypothetical protein
MRIAACCRQGHQSRRPRGHRSRHHRLHLLHGGPADHARGRRREFISLLSGAAAAWPMAARAQQPSKLPTIGFLSASTPAAWGSLVAAFERRLRELGWIEGRTVNIDYRWAEGAASVMVRSQPNSPALRSMLSLRREVPCLQPSGRHQLFQLYLQWQSIRSVVVWLHRWRAQVETPPAC